eukprot:scpid53245/ scgid12853/ 
MLIKLFCLVGRAVAVSGPRAVGHSRLQRPWIGSVLRHASSSTGDWGSAAILAEYLRDGNLSQDLWSSTAGTVPRPMKDTVVACMLERGLHTFAPSTVEAVMMTCAKTLLVDNRTVSVTTGEYLPRRGKANSSSPAMPNFCSLVQQLPEYMKSCKLNDVDQATNFLWAALTVSPHHCSPLLSRFLLHFSGRLDIGKVEYSVYLSEAIQRNFDIIPDGGPLLELLATTLSGRIKSLTVEQALITARACCVIYDSPRAKQFCCGLDQFLSSRAASLDADNVALLCFCYDACSHPSSLQLTAIIGKVVGSMSSSGVRIALRYGAQFLSHQVSADWLARLGGIVVEERSATDLLYSLRSISILASARPDLNSACGELTEKALATVQNHLDRYAAHHVVQLLEFLAVSGIRSEPLSNTLAMLALQKIHFVAEVGQINLLSSIACIAEQRPHYSMRDDCTALVLHHPLQEAHCHASKWLSSLAPGHFSQRPDMFPKLCVSLRRLRLPGDLVACVLQRALELGLKYLGQCGTDRIPECLHQVAFTLAVYGYKPARDFLSRYCTEIIHLSQDRSWFSLVVKRTNGDLALSVAACLYATMQRCMSPALPASGDLLVLRQQEVELRLLLNGALVSGIPAHITQELLPSPSLASTIPVSLWQCLESYRDCDSVVTHVSTRSGVPVPVLLCTDTDGSPVSKDVLLGRAGLTLNQAEFIGCDVHAVAIVLLNACHFAVMNEPSSSSS